VLYRRLNRLLYQVPDLRCTCVQRCGILQRDRLPGLRIHPVHERVHLVVFCVEHVVGLILFSLVDELQRIVIFRSRIFKFLHQTGLNALLDVHRVEFGDELVEFSIDLLDDGPLADEDVTSFRHRIAAEIVCRPQGDSVCPGSLERVLRVPLGRCRPVAEVPVPRDWRCVGSVSEGYSQRCCAVRGVAVKFANCRA